MMINNHKKYFNIYKQNTSDFFALSCHVLYHMHTYVYIYEHRCIIFFQTRICIMEEFEIDSEQNYFFPYNKNLRIIEHFDYIFNYLKFISNS